MFYLVRISTRSSIAIARRDSVPTLYQRELAANFRSSFLPSCDEQADCRIDSTHLLRRNQAFAEIYTAKLGALAELKQSILQKAFSGELLAAVAAIEEAAE